MSRFDTVVYNGNIAPQTKLANTLIDILGVKSRPVTPEDFCMRLKTYIATHTSAEMPLTLSGLCMGIGFSSIKKLNQFISDNSDHEAVEYAKLYVEQAYELQLHSKVSQGAIFALKAMFGWDDKVTITYKQTVTGNDVSELTDDELRGMLNERSSSIVRRINE